VAGIVGARLVFLAETDAEALLDPAEWLGSRGFSFYGGMIFGPLAAGLYMWRKRLPLSYLDAMAAGFPAGMAIGRLGDVVNGEHYGAASSLPFAFRYTHPDAEVPSSALAYHSGGFYEVILAVMIFVLVWPLRDRFRRPLTLLWTVVALYAAGRFAMFFFREDSETVALGLTSSHLLSLLLLALAAGGFAWSRRQAPVAGGERRSSRRAGSPGAVPSGT
jgi:phosphatidylglycerol:prolipoprotein diacylglycerol transferase